MASLEILGSTDLSCKAGVRFVVDQTELGMVDFLGVGVGVGGCGCGCVGVWACGCGCGCWRGCLLVIMVRALNALVNGWVGSMDVIMVWAWMHWPMDALVAWTLSWFGHGCTGQWMPW